jgi:RNA polymerase sigma factor (sigma-70 family)
MARGSLGTLLHYLHRLGPPDGAAGAPDAELLRRYTAQGDQAAFAALVHRHGPMVWGVCTRLLPRAQDAEDAFQATFLVLVRKAAGLRGPDLLGPWLYGVAYRTALKARAGAARRQARERAAAGPAAAEATPDLVWRDLRPVLDEEVSRLPERYRAPLLLCYLEGLTNEEAARRLACPKGTVLSRLARARERLRRQLTRRGLGLSAALLSAALAQNATAAAVPAALVDATLQSCHLFATGAAAQALSAPAAVLAEGVLRSMLMAKLKPTLALVLTLGVVGSGAGLFTHRTRATPPTALAKAPVPPPKEAKPDKPGFPAPPTAPDRVRDLREALAKEVKYSGVDDPKTTLVEALDMIAKRYELTFDVNEKAFAADGTADVLKTPIAEANAIPEMNARLGVVLRKVLTRVPAQSGVLYLIRKGHIEITTGAAVRAELGIPAGRPLLPLVWESFEAVPLGHALKVLADATDYNIVLDPRVESKLKTAVSARLYNVPVDTAVRLLADMEGLQPVRLDNVFYVTTPENAARLRAEQDKPAAPRPAAKPVGKAEK